MDKNKLQMAVMLLDELVKVGQVPKRGAVFGNPVVGFLDYEGVKNHIMMGTQAGIEAAQQLFDGVFGEDSLMRQTPGGIIY